MVGKLMAFVATTDFEKARDFYEHTLGLAFVSEDEFALVFRSGEVSVRIAAVKALLPAAHTVLGWQVDKIEDEVRTLAERGVAFQRFPFLEQDELGIWTAPDGAKVAWFPDPDGNVLSLAQHA
jgi:catechol 2,3-dioxygenase-like lactoylglutathione lyase family enzyme